MKDRIDLGDVRLADAARDQHGLLDGCDLALCLLPVEARARAARRALLVGIDEDHRSRERIGRLRREAAP
mgnify:CR=1 FL=1